MTEVAQYWPAALFMIQAILAWVVWTMRQAFPSREEVRRQAERIDVQERSIAILQERIPSHTDISGLREEIGSLRNSLTSTTARLDGLGEIQQAQLASLNRIQDYLLTGRST